jgi:hypothetical protein
MWGKAKAKPSMESFISTTVLELWLPSSRLN